MIYTVQPHGLTAEFLISRFLTTIFGFLKATLICLKKMTDFDKIFVKRQKPVLHGRGLLGFCRIGCSFTEVQGFVSGSLVIVQAKAYFLNISYFIICEFSTTNMRVSEEQRRLQGLLDSTVVTWIILHMWLHICRLLIYAKSETVIVSKTFSVFMETCYSLSQRRVTVLTLPVTFYCFQSLWISHLLKHRESQGLLFHHKNVLYKTR